jgi:hypothetical protein
LIPPNHITRQSIYRGAATDAQVYLIDAARFEASVALDLHASVESICPITAFSRQWHAFISNPGN